MMKIVRTVLCLMCLIHSSEYLTAQMSHLNSLHQTDIYSILPAYGGLDRSLSLNFNYRSQWTSLEGNPEQLYVNAHLPVRILKGGAGMTIHQDRVGSISLTSVGLSYNRLYFVEDRVFSLALKLGMTQASNDGNLIITPEGIYENGTFSHEDPLLSINVVSGVRPDYSISLFAGAQNYDLGISFYNQFLPDTNIGDTDIESNKQLLIFGRFPRMLFGQLIQPSFLIRSDFQRIQSELSVIVKNGKIFGGLGLRGYSTNSLDALVLSLGIKLNKHYTISYAYDQGLSKLGTISGGSHEINVNYNLNRLLGIGMPPPVIYNPRNL